MSKNPVLNSHPNSNLNKGCVLVDVGSPEFNRRGVWSYISLVDTQTMVKGIFSSHSVVIMIQSSVSNVGVAKLFAHMYFLLDIFNSLKFRPSITSLNKKGHLAL
jgi:hypothetical protein